MCQVKDLFRSIRAIENDRHGTVDHPTTVERLKESFVCLPASDRIEFVRWASSHVNITPKSLIEDQNKKEEEEGDDPRFMRFTSYVN